MAVKRERGKTTQRKKGYQPGHQCKQPITGSTLMSSSQSPHLREERDKLLPSITCLPISHRWCQTLISPTLLGCTYVGGK